MTDDELLNQARQCVLVNEGATREDREEARIDLGYKAGQQWNELALSSRGQERVTLTINKIPSFTSQVVNRYRQNRPGIAVSPVDSQGDPKTAQVIAGMLRNIYYVSNGDTAQDIAFESAVDIGWGYFRLLTDYEDSRSFNQEVKFGILPNPFAVYFDPLSVELDGSDAAQCAIVDVLTRDAFERKYPDGAPGGSFTGETSVPRLYDQPIVEIAEYFYLDMVPDRLLLLNDGAILLRSEVPRGMMSALSDQIVGERPTERRIVRWCKLTNAEVLEQGVWPGQYIPVVPVYGHRIRVQDRWRCFGMIRWLRDPQTMLNYWESTKTEMLAQMPKSKWIGAEGQFEGHEDQWRNAHLSNYAYLEYKSRTDDGMGLPAPQRQFPDPPPQGFIEASLHSAQHMKEISGIYDASLGNRSNETSGIAIEQRQAQGDIANFHFFDNAMKSLRHAQRIILDVLPVIYDAPRMARVLGEDRSTQLVPVNQRQVQGGIPAVLNDLTVGKYDVILSAGPSFQTRRQEAATRIDGLLKSWPALSEIAGDYLLQNLDWPDADAIATRWRQAKGLESPEQGEMAPEEQLQRLQQQMSAMQKQMQALNAYAQQCEAEQQRLAAELAEAQAAHELKEREVSIKEEQVRLDAQIEAQKLALQEQELALRAREMGQSLPEQEGFQLVIAGLQEQIAALAAGLAETQETRNGAV